MPTRKSPSLTLRSKTRKETTNRSRAKFSRDEIKRMGKRNEIKRMGKRDDREATEDGQRQESRGQRPRTTESRRTARPTGHATRRSSAEARSTSEGTGAKRRYTEKDSERTSTTDSNATSRTQPRGAHPSERPGQRDKRNPASRPWLEKSKARRGGQRRSSTDVAQLHDGDEVSPRSNQTGVGRGLQRPIPGKNVEQGSELRINKFLADAGISSRRGADELIAAGVVKVNGKVVTEPGRRVHPGDLVTVKGEPVSYIKHLTYLVLNKPKDYITTTNDEKGRKTVMDLIPIKQRLYPVGRLDRNTTGALIVSNDGELATRLMHPRYEVEREYVVGLDKRLNPEHARAIAQGVELDDGKTGPCEIFINPEDRTELRIVLKEGRNREVRRLFEHFDYEVKRLHRARYANITVTGLSRGEYRHLSREEVRSLRAIVNLQRED